MESGNKPAVMARDEMKINERRECYRRRDKFIKRENKVDAAVNKQCVDRRRGYNRSYKRIGGNPKASNGLRNRSASSKASEGASASEIAAKITKRPRKDECNCARTRWVIFTCGRR